ncbi:hypothetical protein SAMN05446635_0868 [Burkholderia sp. OK233]|nr:hypothetical protein SAMN05446635_0868 [Burkholderia sp. OK233]
MRMSAVGPRLSRWRGHEAARRRVAGARGDALQRHAILRSDMNCIRGAARTRGKAEATEADGADRICNQVRPAACRNNDSISYRFGWAAIAATTMQIIKPATGLPGACESGGQNYPAAARAVKDEQLARGWATNCKAARLRRHYFFTKPSSNVTRRNGAVTRAMLCISYYKVEIRGRLPCAIFRPTTHILQKGDQ